MRLLLLHKLAQNLMNHLFNLGLDMPLKVGLRLLLKSGSLFNSHWMGDFSAIFFSGFDPLFNDNLQICKRLFLGLSICHTAGQFNRYGKISGIFWTPDDLDSVFGFHNLYCTIAARTCRT